MKTDAPSALPNYMHHSDTKNNIFCADLRAFGKGFDEYIQRSKNKYEIKCVRSRFIAGTYSESMDFPDRVIRREGVDDIASQAIS